MISYDKAVIYTSSKLRKCLSLSSMKADYVALSDTGRTITWLQKLLHRFRFLITQRLIKVFQDSAAPKKLCHWERCQTLLYVKAYRLQV